MRKLILCLSVLWHLLAAGQVVQTGVTPYYRTDGYSAELKQALAFTTNTAALGTVKSFGAGLYGEKKFLLRALGQYQLAVALPVESGAFGLDARYFGSADYNETKLGLAYGRSLGQKANVGVQFNYINQHIAGYGNRGIINIEAATLVQLTQNLNAGLHLYNPTALLNKEESFPSVYTIGLGYTASPSFFIAAEIIKQTGAPVNVHAGLTYKIDTLFSLRAGALTGTGSFYFGSEFHIRSFALGIAASVHPQLGVTPGITLSYNRRP